MSIFWWSLVSLGLAYVLIVIALGAFQRRLQYFPDRRLTHLAQTGMRDGEELRLATTDGETLVAWFFLAKNGLPLILYFHGNAGALVDRVARFRMFATRGYGLFAISYRGACARGYDGDKIVILGASLGTGAATHEAAALVLEAPYLSALDVASARYPLFPVGWLMLDQFRSDLAIGRVHVPVLMIIWRGRRGHSDKFGEAAIRTRQSGRKLSQAFPAATSFLNRCMSSRACARRKPWRSIRRLRSLGARSS